MKTTTSDRKRHAHFGPVLWILLPLLTGCLPGGSDGERLYRRHCASCHGVDGGGGIQYQVDEGADLLDDIWKHGGDRRSLEYTMEAELVFEHPTWSLTSQEIELLVDHIQFLRDE